jgi:hypothetical protein
MRIRFTVAVLAAVIGVGCACGAEKIQVDVYINGHDDSLFLLRPGTAVASEVYERIGIRLNWHTGEPKVAQGRPVYKIRTVEQAPASVTRGALASSENVGASGTEITVYKDRMLRFLTDGDWVRCDIHSVRCAGTGYVLAHELAHLMQGIARHSESGILKAHWTNVEYREMSCNQLAFTETDVELIHRGLVQLAPALVESGNIALLKPAER